MNEETIKKIKDQMVKKWVEDMNALIYPGTIAAPQPQTVMTQDMLQKLIDDVNALPKIDRLVKIIYADQDEKKIKDGLEKFGFIKSPYMVDHYIDPKLSYDLMGIMLVSSFGCKRNHLILEWSSGKITEIEVTKWEE